MKKLLTILALVAVVTACGHKKNNTTQVEQTDFNLDKEQVAVLYFHSNHRCATCMAVENVTKEALSENYKDSIPFYSIDITDDKNQSIVKDYAVAGQTLLVVKNDKKINLTSNAFMYARSKPEKVKEEIKTTIDSL